MLIVLSKKNELSIVYKVKINQNINYLNTINKDFLINLSKNFIIFNLLKLWIKKYVKVFKLVNFYVDLYLFLFFQEKVLKLRNYANSLASLNFILVMTFKSMHLRVNYYDLLSYIFQYYSIGMLLSLFKLESKSYRRSLKGVKVLLSFLLKKLSKKYFRRLTLLKINGLTKNYLKFFYMLSSLLSLLSVKLFIWSPIKSWDKTGVKKIKSIKRRIRKKLIKIEQKI